MWQWVIWDLAGVRFRALSILRQASASNHVEIVVTRDEEARWDGETGNWFLMPGHLCRCRMRHCAGWGWGVVGDVCCDEGELVLAFWRGRGGCGETVCEIQEVMLVKNKVCLAIALVMLVGAHYSRVKQETNPQAREFISGRKTSHKHNNQGLSGLQQLWLGMPVNTRYTNSTRGTSSKKACPCVVSHYFMRSWRHVFKHKTEPILFSTRHWPLIFKLTQCINIHTYSLTC